MESQSDSFNIENMVCVWCECCPFIIVNKKSCSCTLTNHHPDIYCTRALYCERTREKATHIYSQFMLLASIMDMFVLYYVIPHSVSRCLMYRSYSYCTIFKKDSLYRDFGVNFTNLIRFVISLFGLTVCTV